MVRLTILTEPNGSVEMVWNNQIKPFKISIELNQSYGSVNRFVT